MRPFFAASLSAWLNPLKGAKFFEVWQKGWKGSYGWPAKDWRFRVRNFEGTEKGHLKKKCWKFTINVIYALPKTQPVPWNSVT